MIGCRPLSSLGNFACRLRNEDCASASLFCEESCTTKPLASLSVASGAARAEAGGAAAVRVRAAGAAAGSLGCGSSEIGPPLRAADAVAAFGAAGAAAGRGAAAGWLLTGLPLTSDATLRIFLGSVDVL